MFERGEMRKLPTNLKCEICGRLLTSAYHKKQHMDKHYQSKFEHGITPVFKVDSVGDLQFSSWQGRFD